jgi:hypothetical protein
MRPSPSRQYLAAATAIVILGLGAALLLHREPPPENTNTDDELATENPTVSPDHESLRGTLTIPIDDTATERSDDLSELEVLEQERWKISRGFITDETRYLTRLSAGELDMMIEQGSTQAMRIRGARLLNNPVKMFQLFEDAIVLGDIPALLTAASVWPPQGVASGSQLLTVSEDPVVNMLAMMLTAQLRGDNLLTPEWKDRLLTGVDLTHRQVAEACSASYDLLEKLESERARKGLPPFDNDPSPHGEKWTGSSPISATCD